MTAVALASAFAIASISCHVEYAQYRRGGIDPWSPVPMVAGRSFSMATSHAGRDGLARGHALGEGRPHVDPEAPELFERVRPSHPGQVGEDHERFEAQLVLHGEQRVADLLGRAHDPRLAGH